MTYVDESAPNKAAIADVEVACQCESGCREDGLGVVIGGGNEAVIKGRR